MKMNLNKKINLIFFNNINNKIKSLVLNRNNRLKKMNKIKKDLKDQPDKKNILQKILNSLKKEMLIN
jgi:hypothetical protein